jgi:hypothetical protein
MAKKSSPDQEKALSLLRAALGDIDEKRPLSELIAKVPDFGSFEWMLTIIGLEIDLRVDIPESLADGLERTAADFARRVAELPKIDSPAYTLECLGLVAQALLNLDLAPEPAQRRSTSAVHKAPVRGSKVPRKKALSNKRKVTKKAPKASPERKVTKKTPAKRSRSRRS